MKPYATIVEDVLNKLEREAISEALKVVDQLPLVGYGPQVTPRARRTAETHTRLVRGPLVMLLDRLVNGTKQEIKEQTEVLRSAKDQADRLFSSK